MHLDWTKEKTVRHGLALRASGYSPLVLMQADFSADRPLAEKFYDLTSHVVFQWPGTVLGREKIVL